MTARRTTVEVVQPGVGSGYVDIARLDSAWNEVIETRAQVQAEVLLDLSRATYVDQEVLLYLVALIDQRKRQRQPTSLALPSQDATVDFLRAWQLPEAIRAVTNRAFESFLDEHDRKIFSALQRVPSRYLQVVNVPGGGRETLLPASFFAITPVRLGDSAQAAASLVRDAWLDEHVKGVLENHLGTYADRIGPNVLHEAVLNAASHPGAEFAYTSSQLDSHASPDGTKTRRELVLVIWDDGDSFVQTLLRAWRELGTVRSAAYGTVVDNFALSISDRRTGELRHLRLSSGDELSAASPEELMLSAFFLGVTCQPQESRTEDEAEESYSRIPEDWLPTPVRTATGLGLHIMRKTVIDLFGGSIYYASGPFRMRVAAGDAESYQARLTRLRDTDPQLKGNLLVARLNLVAK